MNKKQQKHELLVTFMAHIRVKKKRRPDVKSRVVRAGQHKMLKRHLARG